MVEIEVLPCLDDALLLLCIVAEPDLFRHSHTEEPVLVEDSVFDPPSDPSFPDTETPTNEVDLIFASKGFRGIPPALESPVEEMDKYVVAISNLISKVKDIIIIIPYLQMTYKTSTIL